jgi:uncharacterized protein YndB with AHSA1/START domain
MTIRKSITVERPLQIAFKVFCEEMDQWWPGGFGKGSKVFIEGRVGGRYYERSPDGIETEIGRVTAYEPPRLVAFTFCAPDWEAATQVAVRFTTEGSGTRLDLEHSGWEQDATLRDARAGYEKGWDFVLGRYQTHSPA